MDERVLQPWVDGCFITDTAADPVEITEPATGLPFATVNRADTADVDLAVEAARRALDGPWRRASASERSRLLHRLADLLQRDQDTFAELEARNVGKAISSVRAEIGGAIETLRFFAACSAPNAGRSSALGPSLLSYTLREPVGICGLIVPWNYPLLMTVWKVAPALAAGCAVVVKPDIKTPASALELARLAQEAGVPDGVLNVVPGGPHTGAAIVAHRGVDKISFTGSTATGSEVTRLAADPVKRLTLELGGKSASILFADADLSDAIPSACWSVFYAAGQSCEARSRILVQSSVYDEVVAGLIVAARKIVVGDPMDARTQVGSLISREHRERVHGFVQRGMRDGATVVLGGSVPDGPGAFYPPTVLVNVRPGTELEQEEVFGPVLAVQPFDDEEEAISLANSTKYGLFASVWSGDPARPHRVAARLRTGMVGINVPYTAFPGIPFGGYKQSGFGRELSQEALDAYTEVKGVLVGTGSRPSNPFRL